MSVCIQFEAAKQFYNSCKLVSVSIIYDHQYKILRLFKCYVKVLKGYYIKSLVFFCL